MTKDIQGTVVVTWDQDHTRILAVTRQDDDGRILSVIAEVPAPKVQPKGMSEYAEVDDRLLTGQAQHLIGALMNHGLLSGKTLPDDKYLKLRDVVKVQLRVVHREAVRAAQAPAPVAEERDRLRAAQAAAVMPLIGPLLDAWEQADREVMAADEPELWRWLKAINTAMETAGEEQS